MPRWGNAFVFGLAAVLAFAVLAQPASDRFLPALAFLLTALYLLAWAAGDAPLRGNFVLVPLGAMACWSWLPQSVAAARWTGYFALAFLSAQLFASKPLRRIFLRCAILFGAGYGAFALAITSGTFANRNHFAALMELLLPIAGWEAAKTRKPVYAVASMLMALSIVVSASRAGIVLAGCEVIFLSLAMVRKQGWGRAKPLLAGTAALVIAAAALGGTAWNRFGQLEADTAHSTRPLTARASIAMFRARPLIGFGLGTWERTYPRFAEIDTGFHLIHADDDWLEWAAEGGVPFVFCLLLLTGAAVRGALRHPWAIGPVAVLLHALTEFPLQKPAVLSWLLVLLVCATHRVNLPRSST